MPMVAGIVLFALGLKTALADVTGSMPTVPAVGLVGGVALYLLAHVALRLRISGGFGRGRPVAALALLGLFPVVRELPAIAALGIVAGVCVSLIGYEAVRHREARAWIRSRPGSFTTEDALRLGEGSTGGANFDDADPRDVGDGGPAEYSGGQLRDRCFPHMSSASTGR